MLLLTIMILSAGIAIYKRYYPVKGVQYIEEFPKPADTIEILDVREYNQSYKDPIPESLNLPIAYLKRHRHELSGQAIHLVASSRVEKNMSIRWLKSRGYKVIGYTLTDSNSPNKQNRRKGYCYGI